MYKIENQDISIIIPVKNNKAGVEQLLDSFIKTQTTKTFPKELIIIDNNEYFETIINEKYIHFFGSIKAVHCIEKGPAAARNFGANIAIGKWLLFIDSDCVFSTTTISGFCNTYIENTKAFSGVVKPLKMHYLAKFYEHIKLLNAPINSDNTAQYLVTANCIVSKHTFCEIGGFDTNFSIAGGEDLDFSIRLLKISKIAYTPNALVFHDFKNSYSDFYNRFFRYGKGLKQIHLKYNLGAYSTDVFPKNISLRFYFLKLIMKKAFKKGYKT